MMTEALTTADLFDPVHRGDPGPLYRRMRAAGRLLPSGFGIYLVTGYEDCEAILTDPDWGHGYFAGINPFRPGVDPDTLPGSFLLMDPPDHTRLRRLVSKAFTPRTVSQLRPMVTELVDDLLDALLDRGRAVGEVDLVEALAYPVPLTTICRILGVPAADQPMFGAWTRDVSRGLDPDALLTEAEKTARVAALAKFTAYLGELIALRRRRPGDDLLSRLAEVADAGDRLTAKELLDIGVLLLIGGHETTMNLIANGVLALSRHPEQQRRLAADPHLAGPAVEEFLRYDTSVPFPTRVALRDREVAGRTLPRGTGVILLVASANRDPAAYENPDGLDLGRFGAGRTPRRHLAFSQGGHYCLGAPLARLEAEIVFERLFRRAPALRVADLPVVYRPSVSMRGPAALPVHPTPQ